MIWFIIAILILITLIKILGALKPTKPWKPDALEAMTFPGAAKAREDQFKRNCRKNSIAGWCIVGTLLFIGISFACAVYLFP